MTLKKLFKLLFLLIYSSSALMVSSAHAIPLLFSGADAGSSTINSDAAFAAWSNDVGSFTLDNLDGLSQTSSGPFGPGTYTSSLGNSFTTNDDFISAQNFSFAVLQDTSLRLTKLTTAGADDVTTFTWDIVDDVDAFGFFSRNNDGGLVTINLNDGSSTSFSLQASSTISVGDNLFWGVSNLGASVDSVTIISTDPVTINNNTNNSNWDRFVYTPVVSVAEPSVLALLSVGLLGIGFMRKKVCFNSL